MAVGVACCTGAGMICTAGEYQETVLPWRPTHSPFIEKHTNCQVCKSCAGYTKSVIQEGTQKVLLLVKLSRSNCKNRQDSGLLILTLINGDCCFLTLILTRKYICTEHYRDWKQAYGIVTEKVLWENTHHPQNLHLRRSSRWLHRISPLGTIWRNSSWLKPQSWRPGMWMPPTSISSMPNSFITQTAQWITWSAVHCTGSDRQTHKAH